jgi:hypothetical protein
MITRSRVFHRANPAVYKFLLYYAVSPWSADPDGFMCLPVNVRVAAIPRGRWMDRLEIQLGNISPVHNTSMPNIPRDKQSCIYVADAITKELQRLITERAKEKDEAPKTVDQMHWKLVDFDEA